MGMPAMILGWMTLAMSPGVKTSCMGVSVATGQMELTRTSGANSMARARVSWTAAPLVAE